jgi:hypothetical protein
MITLKKNKLKKTNPKDNSYICWYESNTRLCGYLSEFNYSDKIESKMDLEPFYGDIDLFGF